MPQAYRPLKKNKRGSITLTLGDVLGEVERLAKKDDRSVSNYITRILKEHIESKKRETERAAA